jgi:hypothetical protein
MTVESKLVDDLLDAMCCDLAARLGAALERLDAEADTAAAPPAPEGPPVGDTGAG